VLHRDPLTAPNDDGAAFERVKSGIRARLESQASNPAAALQLRANEVNTSGFALLRPQTLEEVSAADPAAALRFYRERFSNAADFTFFVAGAFSVDAITPLVEKYVGSLPSIGTAREVSSAGAPSFPSSIVRDTIRKGREPRSQVMVSFFAPGRGDAALEERAIAIASILRTRLTNRLRGVMGATYTVNVGWANLGPEYGTIRIDFICAPTAAGSLTDAAIDEARRLARDGPTAEEVAAVRAGRLDELKTQLTQAPYWINAMERARREGRPASAVASDADTIVKALTVDELKGAARADLPESRYTVITLLPEGP
jgi:zinc protease